MGTASLAIWTLIGVSHCTVEYILMSVNKILRDANTPTYGKKKKRKQEIERCTLEPPH